MRKRDHGLLSNAASLLVCGVLAGVVVAAAAFPAIAVGGLAAKSGADTFEKLPTELQILPAPQITYVYANDGKTLLTHLFDENRHDIPLADVSPIMRQAIISAEDTRFYEHHGVDMKGVVRAFVSNQGGDNDTQGASTLTMQYVRQALQYTARTPQEVIAATEQTPTRKLKEMRYAIALEKKLSKEQILERYLNIAFFGNRSYGIFAASSVYFGKAPKDLTLPEAALLAGLVKSPSTYNPTTANGKPQAKERRDWILDQMVKYKYVSQADVDAAKKADLSVKDNPTPNGCTQVTRNDWGFMCDYLIQWWEQQDAFGATPSERRDRLYRGGYKVVTSLDPALQGSLRGSIANKVKDDNPIAYGGVFVEPGTGRVRAMAVNRTYSLKDDGNGPHSDPKKRAKGIKSTYPNTVNPLLTGSTGGGTDGVAGYQAGSTYKMFTMLAALEKGLPLDTEIRAVSPYKSKIYYTGSEPGPASCDRNAEGMYHWCPKNANPGWMNGSRTMWSGFGMSVNTYFVPLIEMVGAENVVKMAQRLGIQFRDAGDQDFSTPGGDLDPHNWGTFTLGVPSTVPLELANAYATVAADGKYCKPLPINELYDLTGKKLDAANPQCNQAVPVEVARAAADAARCPTGTGAATGSCVGNTTGGSIRSTVGRQVAGKTGTTDANATAWFAGFTPQLAGATFAADPDYRNNLAGDAAAPRVNDIFSTTMRDGVKNLPVVNFTPPSGGLVHGNKTGLPKVECDTVDSAKAKLRSAGFESNVADDQVDSKCPAGTAAGTAPSGSAVRGVTVTILVSNGKGAKAEDPGNPGGGGPGGGPGGGGPGGRGNCRFIICPPPPNTDGGGGN